jgi:hypothetical protein
MARLIHALTHSHVFRTKTGGRTATMRTRNDVLKGVIVFVILVTSFVACVVVVSNPRNGVLLYSWVHITDTQTLSALYPATLNATFVYVESLKENYNIQRIVVTGDLVNTWDKLEQWRNYVKAESLTSIEIDNVAGNHDWSGKECNLTYYYQYTKQHELYYSKVSGDFLFIFVNYRSFNSTGEIWLRNLLSANPTKIPVFCLHVFYNGYYAINKTQSPAARSIVNVTDAGINIVLQGHFVGPISNNTGDWAIHMNESGKNFYEFNTDWQGANRAYVRLFQVYSNHTLIVDLIRIFDVSYPLGSPCVVSRFIVPLSKTMNGG